MFAKVFTQIFDSSIVEKPEVRFTFTDLLTLCDADGVVDMTHEAIARRTNRPLEVIRQTISELEGPDPRSRTPDFDGARIKRLDEHRDWGWMIVNYAKFRATRDEEERKQYRREWMAVKRREDPSYGRGEHVVNKVNHREPKQKQRKKEKKKQNKEEALVLFPSTDEFPPNLNTDAFRTAWGDWQAHRREIKKPLTATSMKAQLAELETWGEQRAINAIRFTIRKGWQGLREDDSKTQQRIPDRRENIQVPITRR